MLTFDRERDGTLSFDQFVAAVKANDVMMTMYWTSGLPE